MMMMMMSAGDVEELGGGGGGGQWQAGPWSGKIDELSSACWRVHVVSTVTFTGAPMTQPER